MRGRQEILSTKKPLETDVLVIGGGIAGASIARELSRYKVETLLVEKGESFCEGASKASTNPLYRGFGELNSIIVKAYMLKPDETLYDLNWPRARQEKESWKIWHEEWFPQLDMPHKELKTLYIATNQEQLRDLERVWWQGKGLGGIFADMEKVDRDFILDKEPNINKDVIAGLWSDTHHRTVGYPFEWVIALIENAQQNGVRVMRRAEVTGISRDGDSQVVETTMGPIKTKFIINAAAHRAEKIARMVGPIDWESVSDQLMVFILDEAAASELVTGNNYLALPAKPGYMQSLVPTLEGNLFCNVTRIPQVKNIYDTSVTREQYQLGLSLAREIIPAISEKDIIRAFCGTASRHTRELEDHIVEPHPANPRFITVKLRPPGFAAMPAIAKYLVPQLLGDAGLELTTKPDFNPYREGIPRFHDLTDEERNKLIARDPKYGHVICRCKTVTEGEMVEAIRRGARTVQDIKFMTRAGLGRCQGGFCRPRVIQILARELDIPVTKILEREAPALLYESKELLKTT